MGVQVIPIPIEVVSLSFPFPSPIPCFIPISIGFPRESHSHAHPQSQPGKTTFMARFCNGSRSLGAALSASVPGGLPRRPARSLPARRTMSCDRRQDLLLPVQPTLRRQTLPAARRTSVCLPSQLLPPQRQNRIEQNRIEQNRIETVYSAISCKCISIALNALISRQQYRLKLSILLDKEIRSAVSSRPSGRQQRKPDGRM